MGLNENEDAEELLYEGAQCCRCDLDLDPLTGFCLNDRCPFHVRYQDEIVHRSPPDDEEKRYIEQIRSKPRSSE